MHRPRIRRALIATAAALVAGGTAAAIWAAQGTSAAFPFPEVVYRIDATSGSHQASVLNLPVGQPGVLLVPMPVDVNGDLLPDVAVSLNLIHVPGALQNPPVLGDVIAPNLEINRLQTAVLLGQGSPPLRIEAKLRINDLGGSNPPTDVRFGYATGPGGSIPPYFKAVVGGLADFFNPLSATVDTGGTIGGPPTYRGPLKLVGGVSSGSFSADLGFHYRPLPDTLRVTYGDDDAGQHITYAHTAPREIDLQTTLSVHDGADVLDFDGRIDRLPPSISLDLTSDGSTDALEYRAVSDGRKPDVKVHLTSTSPDSDPVVADLFLESLPDRMHAAWSFPPPDVDEPLQVAFEANGQGVGAVDADIRNFTGPSPHLTRFVPTERQFLSIGQAGPDPEHPHRWITGRIERIRSLAFTSHHADVSVDAELGDGESPLQVSYDCTSGCGDPADDDPVARMAVGATVAPLPDDLSFDLDAPNDPDVQGPMTVTYDASQLADLDADLSMATQSAAPGAACGAPFTMCADLAVRNVPTHLEAVLDRVTVPSDSDSLAVDIDRSAGGPAPDVFATITLGGDADNPRPVVAEATVLGLPVQARVRLHQTWDEVTGSYAVDQARFFACAPDLGTPDPQCPNTAATEIGALEVGVRNFVDRPAGFPFSVAPAPQFATVTGRADDFELNARFTGVRQVQYVDLGALLGVQAFAGDGDEPFAARIDLQDQDLGDDVTVLEDIPLQDALGTTLAEASVTNMPAELAVCFREANKPITPSGLTFTSPCEGSPFGAVQPLAIAYRLSAQADVAGTFESTTSGTIDFGFFNVAYGETMRGSAQVPDLPASLTAHVQLPPAGTQGAVRARYVADAQVNVTFTGEKLVNDASCVDPRKFSSALCVSGTIAGIPTFASLFYDPTLAADNFSVITSGDEPMDLLGLRVTSVEPRPTEDTPQILELTGDIVGLPSAVFGTLDLPKVKGGPTTVDLQAIGRIESVDVVARNYLVPEPNPSDPPAPRVAIADTYDRITFFQRGEAFRATLNVHHLAGGGYRTGRDEAGNKLDTQVVSIDFGREEGEIAPAIRAFADLDLGTSHTIADVVLTDVPTGVEVCVRGRKLEDGAPVDPTFCDTQPRANEGAFHAAITSPANTSGMDVDGFLRQSTGGDTDIMAASVHVTDVPPVVKGVFPTGVPDDDGRKGSLDVGGFATNGSTAQGFGEIAVEMASFDLEDSGYPLAEEEKMFERRAGAPEPFPAPAPADPTEQHLALVSSGGEFHVRGLVRGLQRVFFTDAPCSVPDGREGFFPLLPQPNGEFETTYTCAGGNFSGAAAEPLSVHAVIEDGGERISLTDAGLDQIPAWFQLGIAETEPVAHDLQHTLRARCGPVATETDESCMPPLVRFDSAGGSELHGRLQFGAVADLAQLALVQPKKSLPGIDQIPALGSPGVNARVVAWSEESAGGSRVAVDVGLRIAVPGSLTVDTPQTWDDDIKDVQKATDLKFHYLATDADGVAIPTLGQLQAVIQLNPDDTQIVVAGTHPFLPTGGDIPGELDLGFYLRHKLTGIDQSMLVQAEGRVSAFTSLGATIFLDDPDGPDRIDVALKNLPPPGPGAGADDPTEPSFRLQAEVIQVDAGKPEDPPGFFDVCSIIFCMETEVRLQALEAFIDFAPDPADPAHLIKAVVKTDATENRIHVAGYSHVDVTTAGDLSDEDLEAPFSMGGNVVVDPLNISFSAGIPVLGSADVVLESRLEAGFTVTEATDFRLANNLLVFNGDVSGGPGDDATATLGPIDLDVDDFHAEAWALLVKVLGLTYIPELGSGPLEIKYAECGSTEMFADIIPLPVQVGDMFDAGEGNTYSFSQTDPIGSIQGVVIWPLDDNRIQDHSLLFAINDFIDLFAQGMLCQLGPSTGGLIDETHPDDPLELPGHPVPGLAQEEPTDSVPAEQPDPVDAPDGELSGAVCGTYVFEDVTITGPIEVSEDPDVCNEDGQPGLLQIVADTITVEHDIDAAGVVNGLADFPTTSGRTPLVGYDTLERLAVFHNRNGGAGHVSDGGLGLVDLGPFPDTLEQIGLFSGNPYALATADSEAATEGGYRGGNGTSPLAGQYGLGGGAVVLRAERIVIDATIDVSATPGADFPGLGAVCNNQNGVPVEGGNLGPGGGSGGGIVVNAPHITLTDNAALLANGGNGGDAGFGGGGGAGGVIKLLSAVDHFAAGAIIEADPGQGGTSTSPCPDGDPGGPGDVVQVTDFGRSRAHPYEGGLWRRGDHGGGTGPALHFSAAVTTDIPDLGPQLLVPDQPSFQVVACGLHAAPGADGGEPESWAMPSAVPFFAFPCGVTATLAPAAKLGHTGLLTETDEQVLERDDYTIPISALPSGYWGVWTTIVKHLTPTNDCFDATDFLIDLADLTNEEIISHPDDLDAYRGLVFDRGNGALAPDCITIESIPGAPDTVLAIDNVDPVIDQFVIDADPTTDDNPLDVTRFREVTVSFTFDDIIDNAHVSGVTRAECWEQVGNEQHFFGCNPVVGGEQSVTTTMTLSDVDGYKEVHVKVFDKAGNTDEAMINVLQLDRGIPNASIQLVPDTPTLLNDWYEVPPGAIISGYDDGTGTGPPNPGETHVPWFFWQVDDGEEHACPGDPCVIDSSELPGAGRHVLHFTAVDRAGNRRHHDVPLTGPISFLRPQMHQQPIKIDAEAPLTGARIVAEEPDGTNGWYRHHPWVGLAGFDRPVGGSGLELAPGETPGAGVFYDRTTNSATVEAGALYTQPFQLLEGVHTVCTRSIDVAGNGPGPDECLTDIKVDTLAPAVLVFPTPAAPDGANGWYVSEPDVAVGAFDGLFGGSGVAPADLLVSVDGGPYVTYSGPIHVGEGVHRLRAYATDRAGNRSEVIERHFHVDRSHPVSSARLFTPDPARSPWWRARPTITLRATDGDQNAGVEAIEYRLDNGPWLTYTAPFVVPVGVHGIDHRAVDRSGPANAEPHHHLTVATDEAPPSIVATAPNKLIWSRLLGPKTLNLAWQLSDDLSGPVEVTTVVYNVLGLPVRTLTTVVNVAPGFPTAGWTVWDGKDETLLGLVPLGIYHYRVTATDAAGNVATSGEGKPVTIKAL